MNSELPPAALRQSEVLQSSEVHAPKDDGRKTTDDHIATFGETVLQNQSAKLAAEHAIDFELPIYNIWKQQEKTEGSDHFGNTEPRWLALIVAAIAFISFLVIFISCRAL
jgi:hypothetical protein